MNKELRVEATKADNDKPMLSLLPAKAINEIGAVLTFGANKYGAQNWRKGMAWSRFASAALRHIVSWMSGEDKDPESGLHHLAHAACCLLFLLEYHFDKVGEDDRN